MGKTYSGDKIYFDELTAGISSGVNHDDSFNWDLEEYNSVLMGLDVSLANGSTYIASEILDVNLVLDIDTQENYANYINLLSMTPEVFHNAEALVDFLDEAGLQTGSWVGYINDLESLIDKYKVSDDYLQRLADLVGYTIIGDVSEMTTDEKRQQLIQVIDWYKMKGTYNTIGYVGYLLSFTLNFWDMYTKDYINFIKKEWYVGKEGQNPPGLDSSYYKSPHFGIEMLLNRRYGDSGGYYLFKDQQFSDLINYVEEIRPINSVPHYSLFLNPVTTANNQVTVVDGDIKTITLGSWDTSKKYFDQDVTSSAGDDLNFDDGAYFDETTNSSFAAVCRYKLGTGNKGVDPSTSGFILETPILTGTISTITFHDDKVEYEFEINSSALNGISELGLYLIDETTLKIASTFPDIDLEPNLTLRVVVTIYR